MKNFLKWADNRHFISVRAFVIYATVWMTWKATDQAWIFASTSTFDGVGTAAVVAAITAPIAALQGFVFKDYIASRS
jgi:hypothetical protein